MTARDADGLHLCSRCADEARRLLHGADRHAPKHQNDEPAGRCDYCGRPAGLCDRKKERIP